MENKSTVVAIEIGEQTEEHPEPSTSTFQDLTTESNGEEFSASHETFHDTNQKVQFTSTPKKRGRKRNSQTTSTFTSTSEIPDVSNTCVELPTTKRQRKLINYSFDSDEEGSSKHSKRKSRPKTTNKVKSETVSNSTLSNENLETAPIQDIRIKTELFESSTWSGNSSQAQDNIQKVEKPRKRGRPRKYDIATVHNGSGNQTQENTELSNSDGNSQIINRSPQKCICAVCNEEMFKVNWAAHKLRYHNNLTWRVGDPPLDLNDEKVVMHILNAIYKKRLPLYCATCGESKKSVGGLLSHQTTCSKSAQEVAAIRVKCEFCAKTMLPVSMSAHLKYCKGARAEYLTELRPENDVELRADNHIEPVILSKSKRKAAVKADSLIQSFKEDVQDNGAYLQTWFINKQFWFAPELLTRIRTDIWRFGSEKCAVKDCHFISTDAVAFAQHYQTCVINHEDEFYVCKYCVSVHGSEDDMLAHIKGSHRIRKRIDGNFDVEAFGDEAEDDDTPVVDPKKSTPIPTGRLNVGSILFLLQNRYCSASSNVIYPPAYDWTLNFYRQNFCIPKLFPNWHSNDWEILDTNLVHQYLPCLNNSAYVKIISSDKFIDTLRCDYDWKKYKLFESEISDDGNITIFCGGQIFAMAWLPTPFDNINIEQILAVCASSCSMDKLFTLDEVYHETDLIQFWNCGTLNNGETIKSCPKLEFCIAHDHGPVRCLEWCPSGCYECASDKNYLQRLGILAVGCSNSNILVYVVNRPIGNRGKIYKLKPVLKLLLESTIEKVAYGVEAHVTKISWSRAVGHQFIAAGYANGMVAIFDLSTTSSLLRLSIKPDGIEVLMPFILFKAHYHTITGLHLHHLNGGKRWLMTGSMDRSIKYWDLTNVNAPISSFSKATVTDGIWLCHWLCSIHSFDDCCGTAPTSSTIYQPRNFVSEHSVAMYSNCHIWSIAGSEWANGFVQGNVMGELQGMFLHQLFAGMDNDKSKTKKKVMLGYVSLVEKGLNVQQRIMTLVEERQPISQKTNGTDSLLGLSDMSSVTNLLKADPLNYKEATEKYGVVFCDIIVKSFKDACKNMENYMLSKCSKFYNPQPNIYPMQSINKVVFNPNHSSYCYLATAYQIGFVKISHLEFLNTCK